MNRALRFEGPAGRVAYLGASLTVFLSQHLIMRAALLIRGGDIGALPWWFWFNPFRALASHALIYAGDASWTLTLGMIATLAADAGLVALAFRRAKRIDRGAWTAALVIVPLLQVGAIAWLTVAPDRRDDADDPVGRAVRLGARRAVTSVLVGIGLIVGTVALSTLVFHLYGSVLFLISPFLIATVVGYLANRDGKVGMSRTLGLVSAAFALGGAALIGFAFEGVVCIVLATPLIAIMGLIGAWLGAGLANLGRRGRGTTLTSIAFIPILLAAEAVLPPHAAFDAVDFTDVAAPRPLSGTRSCTWARSRTRPPRRSAGGSPIRSAARFWGRGWARSGVGSSRPAWPTSA